MVRANYQNLDKNIPYTMEYLDKFFGNLLLGEKNRLDNREMQIKKNGAKTTQKTTQKILDILAKNPNATRAELAAATGLSTDGVKWNLDKLKKVRRNSPHRPRSWWPLGSFIDSYWFNQHKINRITNV